jgi:hypothetical protein
MTEKQNINIPLIVTVGLISSVLVFVIILGIEAWFYNELEDEQAIKHDGQSNWKLADQEMAQQEKLHTYRKVDDAKQVVAIPIEEAIKLTAKKYSGR